MNITNTLKINDFAKLCRTTTRTIRFYDQEGLVKPVYIDPFTKYRYFNPIQARDVFKIKMLQEFNISIKEIKKLQSKHLDLGFLDTKIKKLQEEIEQKRKEIEFSKKMKEFLFETTDIEKYFKKESLGPYIIFCKTFKNTRYDLINNNILELTTVANKLEIPLTDTQMVFYHDPVAYKPKDTTLEICLITKLKKIPQKTIFENGCYLREYSKSKIKSFLYHGSFEYIALIYQRIHENRQNKKLLPHEVGFDIHLKGPWNEKSPYNHLTKLCFPLS